MSLYEVFEGIEDPRRKEGLRTTLPQLLCMIIISNLCGHFGGRPISRFSKLYEATFRKELGLKHRVPSHVIFSDILKRIDSKELIMFFNKWAKDFVPLEKGDLVSGDGKALASTVTDHHENTQNFQAVVSVFCQESGLVRAIGEYQNNKQSEIDIVRFLVVQLSDMGLVFCLDALHTQKNGR